MASNKFFTIMVVPEKTQQVKKLVIPGFIFKGAILVFAFLSVLAVIMLLDYANVMNQISQNKKLKIENRELRESVQVFKDKMVTIETTLDRVKTFATKLRIITNIKALNSETAPSRISQPPIIPATESELSPSSSLIPSESQLMAEKKSLESGNPEFDRSSGQYHQTLQLRDGGHDYTPDRKRRLSLLADLMTPVAEATTLTDAQSSWFVRREFEKLNAAYGAISTFAVNQEKEVQYILEKLGQQKIMLASTPTIIPTRGYVTSPYGVRDSPFHRRRRTKMHEGIDIANRYGASIVAPAAGTIIFSGTKPGYGKLVRIDHGNGLETFYGHCSRLYVKKGQRVRRGQRIAAIGTTGHSTGPHVHYEIRAGGTPVDPCFYITDIPAKDCKTK